MQISHIIPFIILLAILYYYFGESSILENMDPSKHREHRERDCDLCHGSNDPRYKIGKYHTDLESFNQKDECGRCRGCIKFREVYKPCSQGYTKSTRHPELLCTRKMCDGKDPEVDPNAMRIADFDRCTGYREYTGETEDIDDY